ncbi:MAG: MYXO-CTERM sorting domain-containing protein, partial [Polyangiales bacterium]
QHGLPKAPLAANVAGWPALSGLTPGSDFLHAVNDAPMAANVPVTSIYTSTDEYIQPYETSIIPGAHNIDVGGNGFVGHFEFFWNPDIYLVMHTALTEPVVEDPATNPDPTDPDETTPDDEVAGSGCNAGGGATGGTLLLAIGAIALGRRRRIR